MCTREHFRLTPRRYPHLLLFFFCVRVGRFLHLMRPIMCVLPEVSAPDRKVNICLRSFAPSLPPLHTPTHGGAE